MYVSKRFQICKKNLSRAILIILIKITLFQLFAKNF